MRRSFIKCVQNNHNSRTGQRTTSMILILSLCYLASVLSFQTSSLYKQMTHAGLSSCMMMKLRRGTTLNMAIIGPVRYSTSDWVDCIKTLPSSRILKRTKGNILFMTAWTLIWTYIYKINKITTALPSTIHSILGSALSLLLVFRTNSAYDRFWEGRKAWGSVIVGIREIAINSVIHINETYHEAIAAKLVMFSVVLKQHLQGDKISAELYPFVKDRDSVDVLQAKRNRPVAVLQELNTMFHSYLREEYRDKVEATLHEKEFQEATHSLSSQVASCERIVKQPVPLAYSRHMSRFLTLYLLTLPFTLIPYLGWLTVPTVASICWSFVSVQEIGHFIEEPFDKLTQVIPLNQMTQVILSDVKEIFGGEVLCNPEIASVNIALIEQCKNNSRQDDNFFSYYE